MHTKWKIKEVLTEKNIELTDHFELHIIELPKVKRVLEENEKDDIDSQ